MFQIYRHIILTLIAWLMCFTCYGHGYRITMLRQVEVPVGRYVQVSAQVTTLTGTPAVLTAAVYAPGHFPLKPPLVKVDINGGGFSLGFIPVDTLYTLVIAAADSDSFSLVIDNLLIVAVDSLHANTLQVESFPDTASIAHWRSAVVDMDSPPMLSLGTLSHDATGNRMRLALSPVSDIFGVFAELLDYVQVGMAYHVVAVDSGKVYRLSAKLSGGGYDAMAGYSVGDVNTWNLFSSAGEVASLEFPFGVDTSLTFTASTDSLALRIVVFALHPEPVTVYIDDVLLEEVSYTQRIECLSGVGLADVDGGNYRYKWNGTEAIKELYGEDEGYDLGSRIFHALIARQLSPDPREAEYPWQSTYAYYANSPIWKIDYKGEGNGDDNGQENIQQSKGPVLAPIIQKTTEKVVKESAWQIIKRNALQAIARASVYISAIQLVTGDERREPLINPKKIPQPDEDGNPQTYLYKTTRSLKKESGLVEVSLPYYGISSDKIVGGRYKISDEQSINVEIIAIGSEYTIKGAETAIILLNSEGNIAKSTRIDNLIISTIDPVRIASGVELLDRQRSGWRKKDLQPKRR
jgi:hypothetical protein